MKLSVADVGIARELITYARANHWTHMVFGEGPGREHLWRSPAPYKRSSERVSLWYEGLEYRQADTAGPRAVVLPESAAEARDWLRMFGIVPTVAQVAEALLTDTTKVGA